MRILVVDDEPLALTSIKTLLGVYGHEVQTAATRAEAESVLAQWPPEIVVLDWMLQDASDGMQTIRLIRGKCPSVGIIVISGMIDDVVQNQIATMDRTAYLHKPFTIDDLNTTIQGVSNGG